MPINEALLDQSQHAIDSRHASRKEAIPHTLFLEVVSELALLLLPQPVSHAVHGNLDRSSRRGRGR
jgi:hypothetical protein